MKLFYAFVLSLMVLVSACTQQAPEVQPEPTPQPEVQPTPEVVEVVEEEPEEVIEVVEPVATTNEVRIVGTEGFEPEELSIVTGSAVTWINDGDRRAAVIIFKDGRSYVNSPPIDSEGKFEHEFNEVGSYEFWLNIAYGVIDGKIIVE